MKSNTLDRISNDLYNTIEQIKSIKIQLMRYAKDPEKVRSLAKQLEKLL